MDTILDRWKIDFRKVLAAATREELAVLLGELAKRHRELKSLCSSGQVDAAGVCLANVVRALIAQVATTSKTPCNSRMQQLHATANTWNTCIDSTVPGGPGTAEMELRMTSIDVCTQAVAAVMAQIQAFHQLSSSQSTSAPSSLVGAGTR